ncbi:MAG TPA: hypothetical protein VE860_03850 [Chthoniobacterales bacterium]|jgi:hypothetical protein|nr:hypothetical protein [Chthoniobacterales bacterium]
MPAIPHQASKFRLATLSPKLISEAAECYERLKPYNVKLLDFANAYIEVHKQRTASVSFLNLCNLYIDSGPDRNRDHLKGLQNSRDRFPVLHDRLVSDITHRDIEPLLAPIPAGGRNLVMRHLRASCGNRQNRTTEICEAGTQCN